MKISHQSLVIATISSLIKNKTHISKKEWKPSLYICQWFSLLLEVAQSVTATAFLASQSHTSAYTHSLNLLGNGKLFCFTSGSVVLRDCIKHLINNQKEMKIFMGPWRISIENTEVVSWVSVWTPLPGFTSKSWLPCMGTDPRNGLEKEILWSTHFQGHLLCELGTVPQYS